MTGTAALSKASNGMPSVFLGLLDIVGFYGCLHRGLKEIGCRSYHLHLGGEKAGKWSYDEMPLMLRIFYDSYKRFHESRSYSKYNLARYWHSALFIFFRSLLVLWALIFVDIFFFKSGESLFVSKVDQRIFRLFGKKVIHMYHGSDERPPYLRPGNGEDAVRLLGLAQQIKKSLEESAAVSDVVISNPLSSHFQSGRCCIAQVLGNSVDSVKLGSGKNLAADAVRNEGFCRILHAPSTPHLKGSDRIRDAIATLKKRGHKIDYVEITGLPNEQVMKELALCDLVVDELYSDDYGALFSVEAMAFGRPAIVCGYGKDELDRFVPKDVAAPTLYTTPDLLIESLEKLVSDENFRNECGKSAYNFSREFSWANLQAKRFLQIAQGKAPEQWFFEPKDVRYAAGVAAPEDVIARQIKMVVEKFGPAGLLLDDKPELRDTLIEFTSVKAGNLAA